jgi:hypothetical protein
LASIAGRVVLVGTLFNEAGYPIGERRREYVSGIRVFLSSEGRAVDSTRTHAGAFLFENLAAGTYAVAAGRRPVPWTSRDSIGVVTGRVHLLQPLVLGPTGPLVAYPSPFVCGESIAIDVKTRGAGSILVSAFDLTLQEQVWGARFDSGGGHGTTVFHWYCDGPSGSAGPGAYWIELRSTIEPVPGRVDWVNLVFAD